MDLKFEPSIFPFLNRVLWLMFPVAFMIIAAYFGALPEDHSLLDLIVVCGVTFGVLQASYLHLSILRLSDSGIKITTRLWREEVIFIKWQQVSRVVVESTNRLFFPNRHIFHVYYGENQRLDYYLSELSDADREKAVSHISARVRDFSEVLI